MKMASTLVRLVLLFALSTLLCWHQETSAAPTVASIAVREEASDQNEAAVTEEPVTISPPPQKKGFRLRGGRKRGSSSAESSSQNIPPPSKEEKVEDDKPEKKRNGFIRRNGKRENEDKKEKEKEKAKEETKNNQDEVVVPETSDANRVKIPRRGGRSSEETADTMAKPCNEDVLLTRAGNTHETIVALLSNVGNPEVLLPIFEDIAMNFINEEEPGPDMSIQ